MSDAELTGSTVPGGALPAPASGTTGADGAVAATVAAAALPATGEASPAEREWVRASVRGVLAEAALYRDTMRLFLRSPASFVREWRQGSHKLMNPLGFLALSVLLLGGVRSFGWWYLERQGSELAAQFGGEKPFWAELWGALGPALHFAALGLICHHTLSLLGNRRVRASSLGGHDVLRGR